MSDTPRPSLTRKNFGKASRFCPAYFDRQAYHERTARNHYWTGGLHGQEAIRRLSVGVAGMGGMGSNIALCLVRLGVGHLRIADPDQIDASNLNRQAIANRGNLGKSKVDASVEAFREIAEDFELVAYGQGIDADTVEEFVAGCDAIVDEIDVYQLEAHVKLHRAARLQQIPLYSAYAIGFGIHFYKFQGDQYTFENFLGNRPQDWSRPTPEFLLERFATPYPSYLAASRIAEVIDEISREEVPIFGPTTLIGHSMVAIRMILDLLTGTTGAIPKWLNGVARTPVMPEFLILDLAEMSLRLARAPL